MRSLVRGSLAIVVVAALLVTLGTVPVAAQSGAGETVVVEEGETVSEVNAVARSVIIRGTVTGDVAAVGGNVVVDGTVEGDLSGAAGNVRVGGDVGGDVSVGGGNVHLEEGATVGGNLEAGAGNVRIDGRIDGDATVGAETIRLGENASIGGSLTYDGTLTGNRDAVEGEITRDATLGAGPTTDIEPVASIAFAVYGFLLNLLLGAVLLLLMPGFSLDVAERVRTEPLRSGLIGLGVLVAVPVILVALAITLVGIPLSLAGAFAFAILAWVAFVYGWFAVGGWLLSLLGAANRWLALFVGLLVGAILSQIPVVGWLFDVVVFLLGLGALSGALVGFRRRMRRSTGATLRRDAAAD